MVGGHWALSERFAGKDHQSDVIIWSADDKLAGHLLGSLDTVRTKVFGQHTSRYVHRQHDVDTLNGLAVPRVLCLWTSQNQYYHNKYQQSEQHAERHQRYLPALGRIAECESVAHPQRGLGFLSVHHIPYYIRYDEQKQQQIFFIGKFHFFVFNSITDKAYRPHSRTVLHKPPR